MPEGEKKATICGKIDAIWNKGTNAIIDVRLSGDSAGTSLAHLSSCRVST